MNNLENIVYTVNDISAAKAIHTALLGAEPHTDQPYYVGFNVGGVEIGLTPKSPERPIGGVAHVRVDNLETALAEVLNAGATLASEPTEVAPGAHIATVTDPDGITLGLIERTNDGS
ncbi:VOC family protein [Actinospongicola halichondriae]|uniref:VOC family protein n=1 Tax=Actinospongicola halichondriae TaxID=3236844 RepID=UPI003D5496E7